MIGDLLGYRESHARRMGRRFYGHLKGDIKNWNYDDNVHYGDIKTKILPVLNFLIKRGYYVPELNV